ncbi:uncharacterized protein FMAN_00280 [Fusarium mangiferae]|uniref:F-box domain-containing protein n=1 Tax=Fusarium mangiferae TaxID=192010 RepID=A0A1L7U4E4_FUSMA|nr:uncharacterized protein FMAN_00280 [Fusarium mangiferae]CVL02835.1 uncharacterized protein FMAN_00280 [Fusarium mangiferae]
MSSQQNSPPPASGSSSELIPRNTLLGLPEELQDLIAKAISEDRDVSVDALCKLTLVCEQMHRIARPYVLRATSYRAFRRAIESACLPIMRLCGECRAAPVEMSWPVRPSWREYRPIDALLLNLDERHDSPRSEQLQNKIRTSVYEALQWLLEKGASGEANLVSESLNGFRYQRLDMGLGHMPTRLLKQLQFDIGRPGVEIYLKMIELLSSYGFPNPTRSNALDGVVATDKLPFYHPACDWADTQPYPFVNGAIADTYFTESPLDLALKSHIPPRLLELMLKEYAGRGVSLLTSYKECPEGLKKTCKGKRPRINDDWVGVSSVGTLIGTLHADLHSTSVTRWRASYHGEVADIFRQKLDIMVKYEMIDVLEKTLLKSILGALDAITAQITAAGRVVPMQFMRSWVTLCEAVRPYCANEYEFLYDINRTIVRNGPGRVHEFVIDTEWNPWYMWFMWSDACRRRDLTIWNIGRAEFHKNRRYFWQKHHGYEIEYILGYFDRDQVQPWYEVDVVEWCQQMLGTFTEDGVPDELKYDFQTWCEFMEGELDEDSIPFEWWSQFTRT